MKHGKFLKALRYTYLYNMKSKKIIHAITRYSFPVTTGLEVNTLNTYAAMVKDGYDVTIHATNDTLTQKNTLPDFEVIRGIKIKRYNTMLYGLSLFFEEKLYMPNSIVVLHDFDISTHFFVYIKTVLLKALTLKKFFLIFSSHGLFNYTSEIYPGIKMKIRKIVQKFIGLHLINYCVDGIRAVSEFEKRGLIRQGINPDLINVITNGIESTAFTWNENEVSKTTLDLVENNSPFLMQVARIDRVKNFEIIIKSLPLVEKSLKFFIVGPTIDKNYKRELEILAKSLGVEQRVIFLGSVVGADKYFLMKKAFAILQMSKAEGFGNAIHEAMSQGAICIVSKNTALEEVVKNNINGYSVSNDSPKEISDKIQSLFSQKNSILIKQIRANNLSQTKGQTWDMVAAKVENFYENVANRRIMTHREKLLFEAKVWGRRIIYLSLYVFDTHVLRKKPDVFILCYHSVSNDSWRFGLSVETVIKQINYLKSRFAPVDLPEIHSYIKGEKNIIKPSFLINFDDGYKEVYQLKDFFKMNGIKPTLFLLSDRKNADKKELDTDREFLSTDEILTLKKDGWTIGNHSATHADFYNLTSEKREMEIINSKKSLEDELGIKIEYFAYPKGRYTSDVLSDVKRAGYSLGLSMDDGSISGKTNRYVIPRIGVDRTHTFAEFKSLFLPSSIKIRKFVKENIGIII